MSDFRNAYHFVPRQPPRPDDKRELPKKQSDYGLGRDRITEGHAAYAPGTHSGRITCRITLETPTVIGAKRHSGKGKGRPSLVEPFLFAGRPAIPASSLKGVLSSIAECVSRAPYRVLTDMSLTVAWNEGATRFRHSAGDGQPTTQMGTTYDYVTPDARPLTVEKQDENGAGRSARRVTRSEVNPVEVMFGFIREAAIKGTKLEDGAVPSAAGKLRISHALPSGEWSDRPVADLFSKTCDITLQAGIYPPGVKGVRLREQSQPMKEPDKHEGLRSATPNFYFVYSDREKQNDFIDKKDFAELPPSDFATQGTKFYLHNSDIQSQPWKSADRSKGNADLERKATVALLKRRVTFDFHVDFDNLSEHELNILCYALRPSKLFRHKIGLGKALGLGSMRIDPVSLVLVDRAARYSAEAIFGEDARKVAADGAGVDRFDRHVAAHSAWLEKADRPAKRALLAIGETHQFGEGPHRPGSNVPVLPVPLTDAKFAARAKNPLAAEARSFEWFVENDKRGGWRQKLKPVGGDGRLPTLSTDRPNPKGR